MFLLHIEKYISGVLNSPAAGGARTMKIRLAKNYHGDQYLGGDADNAYGGDGDHGSKEEDYS